jgi:hypothetical protein
MAVTAFFGALKYEMSDKLSSSRSEAKAGSRSSSSNTRMALGGEVMEFRAELGVQAPKGLSFGLKLVAEAAFDMAGFGKGIYLIVRSETVVDYRK